MGQHKRKPKPTAEDRRRKRIAKETERLTRLQDRRIAKGDHFTPRTATAIAAAAALSG